MATLEPARDAIASARARWRDAPEPDGAFFDLVASCADASESRIADLYLAWWCMRGDPAAIAAFEAEFEDDLRVAAARFRDLPADELRQTLRIKLFVGGEGTPPRIREYAGTGSLRGWVRVTAMRTFIDVTRRPRAQRAEQPIEDADFMAAGASDVPLRAELRALVKTAFGEAVAQLEPRARVFLRHAYVHHHTLDQIAAHYAMHRSTVARVLAGARSEVIERTRRALAAAVGVPEDELSTAVRMFESKIDLSLSRVLAPARLRGR